MLNNNRLMVFNNSNQEYNKFSSHYNKFRQYNSLFNKTFSRQISLNRYLLQLKSKVNQHNSISNLQLHLMIRMKTQAMMMMTKKNMRIVTKKFNKNMLKYLQMEDSKDSMMKLEEEPIKMYSKVSIQIQEEKWLGVLSI